MSTDSVADNVVVWKIPSLTTNDENLLCHGYVRGNFKQYIPNDIIQLFSDYFSKDEYNLNDFKNAYFKKPICSPIISYKSLKLVLRIFPNG